MLHPAAPSSSAVPLSLPFGLLCSFFFLPPLPSPLFRRQLVPPFCSRHQKVSPSASDYLWLQLVSRQPSGPVWRLRSLSSPQTALREGGRDGGEAEAKLIWVGRLKFFFFFLVFLFFLLRLLHVLTLQSAARKLESRKKGTHETVTPDAWRRSVFLKGTVGLRK